MATCRITERRKNEFFASDIYGDFVRRVVQSLQKTDPVSYEYTVLQTKNDGNRLLKDNKYFMGYLPHNYKYYADIITPGNIKVFIQLNAFSYSKLEVWIAFIKGIIPADLKNHIDANAVMKTLIADFSN